MTKSRLHSDKMIKSWRARARHRQHDLNPIPSFRKPAKRQTTAQIAPCSSFIKSKLKRIDHGTSRLWRINLVWSFPSLHWKLEYVSVHLVKFRGWSSVRSSKNGVSVRPPLSRFLSVRPVLLPLWPSSKWNHVYSAQKSIVHSL